MMPPIAWIAVAVLAALLGGGWIGFGLGGDVARTQAVEARLDAAEKVIVRQAKERAAEVKVETQYIQSVQTIHTHSEEVRHEIQSVVAADCLLPDDFMRSLRAVSRNQTVAASGIAGSPGERAGCRSVLDVLAQSYRNHYADAAQLNALILREEELSK